MKSNYSLEKRLRIGELNKGKFLSQETINKMKDKALKEKLINKLKKVLNLY